MDVMVAGSSAETARVAGALGLPIADAPATSALVIVATCTADVDAIRAAVRRGDTEIVAVVAVGLPEDQVVAAFDLGLPVAFGYCTPAELETAIAAAPDDERRLAATLAAIEHAVGTQQ
jgi:6,7-dimethyl-8-ribityllumazine synthase